MKVSVIIMDEPTSALSETEVQALFRIMRDLKQHGISVIFISHRLEEVRAICDRVMVLRDGKNVGTLDIARRQRRRHDPADGGPLAHRVLPPGERRLRQLRVCPKRRCGPGSTRPDATRAARWTRVPSCWTTSAFNCAAARSWAWRGWWAPDARRLSGRSSARTRATPARCMWTASSPTIRSPGDAIRHGIGFVPEDRKAQGLILNQAVRMNLTLPSLAALTRFGFVKLAEETKRVQEYVSQAPDSHAQPGPGRPQPERRQPAEGGHLEMADAEAQDPDHG